MKYNIFDLPETKPMQHNTLFCVGLCNKCKHIEMVNTGNGIDEPLDPIPMCIKRNFEVMPVPKEKEITECEFFEPYT